MATSEEFTLQLIPDTDTAPEKDLLGFTHYSQVLTGVAQGTTGPFTIGVLGEWGTGKTILLRQVEQNLQSDPNIITIWFNAWQYEKEDQIIFPFLSTIYIGLQHSMKTPTEEQIWGPVKNAFRGIIGGLSVSLPPFTFSGKDALEQGQSHVDNILDRRTDFSQALETLEVPEDKKIVVLIDDLDRCNPEKAFDILESIKLMLNRPRFIFMLGVAPNMLDDYIEEKYKSDYHIKTDHLKDNRYLDKIIQLPFPIPSHKKQMTVFMQGLLDENAGLQDLVTDFKNPTVALSMNESASFGELTTVIASCTQYNPRKIKRLLNNLIVDKAIIKSLGQQSQVGIRYVAVWRILEHSYADIYELVRTDSERIDFLRRLLRDDGEKPDPGTDPQKQKLAEQMTNETFRNVFTTTFGRGWLQDKEQRENAQAFFVENREDRNSQENYYRQNIKERPLDPVSYYSYATYLRLRGKFDQAELFFEQAISVAQRVQEEKSYAYILLEFADFLWKIRKNYDRADAFYKTALQLDDGLNPWFHAIYATFLWASPKEDYQGAEREYKEAIRQGDKNVGTRLDYALFLRKIKNYPEAEEIYTTLLEERPGDPSITASFAAFSYAIEKYDQAEEYYLRTLRLRPDDYVTQRNAAEFYYMRDEPEKAKRYWQQAYDNAVAAHNEEVELGLEFLHYMFSSNAGVRDRSKARVEELLRQGVTAVTSGFDASIAQAERNHHLDIETVKRLALAITSPHSAQR